MTLPFVTIGIPAYNHSRYIGQCLNAAANQTYPNLDLVIIDDGSSDDTYRQVEAFISTNLERFRNVVAKTRPNRGLCTTFNDVVRESATEWVCLTGSDDVMYPRRVTALVDAAINSGQSRLALVCGRADWIDGDDRAIPAPPIQHPGAGVHHRAHLDILLSNPVLGPVSMLRREAVQAVGGFDDDLPFEDMGMWLKLSVRYPVAFVDDMLGAYRRHDANASSSDNAPAMLWGLLITTARFLDRHADDVPQDIMRKVFRKNMLRTFRCTKRRQLMALPRLLWDILTFDKRPLRTSDLYRYADLIRALS